MSAIQRAAAAFSTNLEGAMVLGQGRATVVRARSPRGARAKNAIIKQFKIEHRAHFVRERAGLRLISSLPDLKGFVPELLGEDEATLALLLEYIPERATFSARISAGETSAGSSLADVAKHLGELHGRSRELVAQFRQQVLEPTAPGPLLKEGASKTLLFIQRALTPTNTVSAEFSAGSALHSELLNVAEQVDAPSPLTTLTLGDLAPSNVLLAPHGPVFIDLEYCAVRHAFYDAMFWHCVCPFSSDLADRADASYRAGLHAAGVPLSDAQFVRAMVLFMSHRLFWTLSWDMTSLFELDREVVPGVSMRATLLQYLREYVRFAGAAPDAEYPALLSVAERLNQRLSSSWEQG